MQAINHFLKTLFTGRDGQTFDIGRLHWFGGTVAYIGLSGYEVIRGTHVFDYIAWGTGFAAIMAAGGAALKLKESTEPGQVDKGNP